MADHGRYARFRNETLCVRPVTAGTFLLRRDTGTPGRPERPGDPGTPGGTTPGCTREGPGMASTGAVPNHAFRQLRGQRSAGEFAAAVRRAAREIGEQVACDARYIGRVESGEIRCPNYAYERVFLHMFPGASLTDLGFSARESVRGPGRPGRIRTPASAHGRVPGRPFAPPHRSRRHPEESDVLRRVFMTSGTATVAAASLGLGRGARLRRPGLSAHTAPGRRGGGARRREGRTPDPAAGRPARRGRALPAGRPAAARGVRAAGRREHRAARHLGPAARGRGRAGHLGGVAGP